MAEVRQTPKFFPLYQSQDGLITQTRTRPKLAGGIERLATVFVIWVHALTL